MSGDEFEESYRTGDTPWDSGVPSAELIRVPDAGLLSGKTVLEIGCGTGTNAIAFARRGYRVTAVDYVELAVRRGRGEGWEGGDGVELCGGEGDRRGLWAADA